ncbi:MAG TPA: L,D-transpeptidase [Kofleriaceae bacterium]|nr:L,D-transpeptidase [Kofleriaceae bacterium]
MRALACCALLALAGCGNKADKPAPAPLPTPTGNPPTGTPGEPASVAQPDFPEDTRSLELTRTIPVRLDPGDDGKRIGTIAIDTRVGWQRTAKAKGCSKAWVEIRPRGWVCGEFLKASKLPPQGREVPQLERGEIVPGIYGRVTASAGAQGSVLYKLQKPEDKKPKAKDTKKKGGGPVTSPSQLDDKPKEARMVEADPIVGTLTIRQYEELTVDGKVYWKINPKTNEYVLKSLVNLMKPSDFKGTRLGDDTGWKLPVAFIWPRNNWTQAWTYAKPNAISYRQINARLPVAILETATNKAGKAIAYRIADPTPQAPLGEWVNVADVRVFAPVDPPPLLTPNERWIDVDLDNQILVAFEGTTPVYATMVSTGAKDTPTLTGMYRIWLKASEADMKNLKAEDPYSVATVPWTEFFYSEDDLALHTAYWHDAFGKTRSHGCVNLAPRDARWLYYWSDPVVPPGWTATSGVVEAPGSVVRVRSAADPSPPWRGYAKKVAEARQNRNAE